MKHAAADRLASTGKWAGGRAARALHGVFGDRSAGACGILLYHRVADAPPGTTPTRNVPPARFESQIRGLLDRGFQFWPLQSVVRTAEDGAVLPDRVVVLTFDDGYANVFANAWPVLRDLGVPSTVFVTTAYLGTDEPFPFDSWAKRHALDTDPGAWRPLSWAECEQMAEGGLVEFGSHSHTHGDFRRDPDAFRDDLSKSLEELSRRCGQTVKSFAYPYGDVDAGFALGVLDPVVRASGVRCALTTDIALAGAQSDPFSWGRLEATEHDTAATLAAKVTGWYGWMQTGRRLFRRLSRTN